MGLQTVPGYIGQTGYNHPVELDRNMLEGLFSRSGVLRYGDFAIAPTATNQQFSIAAGRAFLLGAESAQQGGYFAWSDVSENKVLGPPSGSARIDAVLLRVVDTQYGSDPGSPRAEWDIVAGTPNSSPVAPADSLFNTGGGNYKPGAWWRVADIRVNVGDTVIPDGQITRYLRYVRQAQGIMLAKSTDTISDMVLGDQRYDIDTGISRRWNSVEWRMTEPWRVYNEVTAATVASVNFSSIPRTLRRLRLTVMGRMTGAVQQASYSLQFGGDTGANYGFAYGYSQNGPTNSQNSGVNQTSVVAGFANGASASANRFGSCTTDITGWNGPTGHTTGLQIHYQGGGISGTNFVTVQGVGEYAGTATPNSILILPGSGSWVQGSTFLLEGWD